MSKYLFYRSNIFLSLLNFILFFIVVELEEQTVNNETKNNHWTEENIGYINNKNSA